MQTATWSGALLGLSLCLADPTAQAAEVALVPVLASGSHTIAGNEIMLRDGGQRVFLELRVEGWAPHQMQAWQATIEDSGYASGSAGVLIPARHECTADAECVTEFGIGATCTVADGSRCTAGFIGSTRPDYVFASVHSLSAVDLSVLAYRYTSTIVLAPAVVDPGTPQYAGALVLDVPLEAAGTFTIGLVGPPDTDVLNERSQPISPLALVPALISVACVPGGCEDGSLCTNDTCGTDGHCIYEPNFDEVLYCCYPADRTLCSKPTGLPGDFDGNGATDLADFAILQACFGGAPLSAPCEGVELNCDCVLDLHDVCGFVSSTTGP